MSASLANLAREGATLNDIAGDLGNLFHLLDVAFDHVTEIEAAKGSQAQKDCASALIWIARDIAKRAEDEMAANSATIAKACQMLREGGR